MKVRKIILKILMGVVVLIAVILIAGVLVIVIQNQKPQVNLGVVDGKFYELNDKPNGVSTQTSFEDKRVMQLAYIGTMEESKQKMLEALQEYGGIKIELNLGNYIYAVATTEKMKFHDDIEMYFDDIAKEIHFRSASRAGYSDMGLNKQRYELIAQYYNQ